MYRKALVEVVRKRVITTLISSEHLDDSVKVFIKTDNMCIVRSRINEQIKRQTSKGFYSTIARQKFTERLKIQVDFAKHLLKS